MAKATPCPMYFFIARRYNGNVLIALAITFDGSYIVWIALLMKLYSSLERINGLLLLKVVPYKLDNSLEKILFLL